MKILFISLYGEGSDLALRLKAEGNQVRLYIKEEPYKDEIYNGLIDKVSGWQLSVAWCDFIVFDSNPLVSIWKVVKDIKPCFGGSEFGEMLEHDREFGRQIMKQIGLKNPESITVNKIEEAEAHLKEHKVPHVVKPFGSQVQSEHLIIGEYDNNEDALGLLDKFKAAKVPYEGIELQEKKKGIEVGMSGWFNGRDWLYPIEINFEHKPIAASLDGHGLGHLTGEMGTVMHYDQDPNNKLFKKTLDRIKPVLMKNNYRGQIDINMIVDAEGTPWALEWTPRFGVPSTFILDELQVTPWGELLYACATGKFIRNQVLNKWAMGVVVVTPGFPSPKEVAKKSTGTPIFGVTKDNAEHIHLYEAQKVPKSKKLQTTHGIGYPLVVTASGDTIEDCRKQVYNLLDRTKRGHVYVPQGWYRIDIGQRVMAQMDGIRRYIAAF